MKWLFWIVYFTDNIAGGMDRKATDGTTGFFQRRKTWFIPNRMLAADFTLVDVFDTFAYIITSCLVAMFWMGGIATFATLLSIRTSAFLGWVVFLIGIVIVTIVSLIEFINHKEAGSFVDAEWGRRAELSNLASNFEEAYNQWKEETFKNV